MGVHRYTNGAWTDSGRIYRNSLNLVEFENKTQTVLNVDLTIFNGQINFSGTSISNGGRLVAVSNDIVLPAGTYRFITYISGSVGSPILQDKNDSTSYYSNGQSFTLQSQKTFYVSFTFVQGTNYTGSARPMLCSGAEIIPFEPFGIIDWYTNNGHEYSSGAWS